MKCSKCGAGGRIHGVELEEGKVLLCCDCVYKVSGAYCSCNATNGLADGLAEPMDPTWVVELKKEYYASGWNGCLRSIRPDAVPQPRKEVVEAGLYEYEKQKLMRPV